MREGIVAWAVVVVTVVWGGWFGWYDTRGGEREGEGEGFFYFYLPILLKYGTICGLRQRWRRSTQALEVVRYGTNCAETGKELALVCL